MAKANASHFNCPAINGGAIDSITHKALATKNIFLKKYNREQSVQECDATGDATCTKAG